MKFLRFFVIAIVASGCCSAPIQVVDVPLPPVLAEYTDEELRAVPKSMQLKMVEETQAIQDYIDKVEARGAIICVQ